MPGTPEFEAIRRETWDDSNLGNAIPGATPSAPRFEVRPPVPGLPLIGRAERAAHRPRTRSAISSTRAFPQQRRYRPPARAARRAAVRAGRHAHRSRFRAGMTCRIAGRRRQHGHRIATAGPASAGTVSLKFDLVSEGVDWFETLRLADDEPAALGAVRY